MPSQCDSAVEAALALADQPDNRVRLSCRGDRLGRVKDSNRERITQAIAAGRVDPLWSTNIVDIASDLVRYRASDGAIHTVENDHVFVFIGGQLPTDFLRACGIAVDTHFGRP